MPKALHHFWPAQLCCYIENKATICFKSSSLNVCRYGVTDIIKAFILDPSLKYLSCS